MTLKEVAEQKAENYVKYALGAASDPEEAFSAKEDYAAGFIDGMQVNAKVTEFVKKQLSFIAQIQHEKGDLEGVAAIKYVISKLIL